MVLYTRDNVIDTRGGLFLTVRIMLICLFSVCWRDRNGPFYSSPQETLIVSQFTRERVSKLDTRYRYPLIADDFVVQLPETHQRGRGAEKILLSYKSASARIMHWL